MLCYFFLLGSQIVVDVLLREASIGEQDIVGNAGSAKILSVMHLRTHGF